MSDQTKYQPLHSPDGRLWLSETTDPKEMREWAQQMEARGLIVPSMLARAFDFMRDAKGMKNHLPIAERIQLCLEQFERALATARQTGDQTFGDVAAQSLATLAPQYESIMPTRIEAFHKEQIEKLQKAKSRPRQLQIASKATTELGRLSHYSLRGRAAEAFNRCLQFWRDQLDLLDQPEVPSG